MELGHALEEAPQLLLGVDAAFVRAGLLPDDAFVVEVGLVDALGDGEGDDDVAVFECDVFGGDAERAADVLAGGVAYELIDAGDVGGG